MFRTSRARVALLGLTAFVFASLADPATLSVAQASLVWMAPAECPDGADMLTRVERSMGGAAVPASLRATAHVRRAADVFRAQVNIRSANGTGQRILENRDCELLADGVALVIALSASEAQHHDGDDGQEAGEDISLTLSAHATAANGPLPALALGAGGALALEGSWAMHVELSGSYYQSQAATYGRENVGATFRLLRIGARGCRVWTLGLLELAPCVGVQVYRVSGEGFGGVRGGDGDAYLWGPALGAFGRLRVSRSFAVAIATDAMLPVSRQRFVYTDLGPLHRPDLLTFQLLLSPEVRF